MTRLWITSDLHQEWPENVYDPTGDAPEGFDAILCVGDVSTPLTRSLALLSDWFGGERIVYVAGNHDFYLDHAAPEDKYTLVEQTERGLELADRLGIDLLVNTTTIVGDTRIAGGTLWTDLRLDTTSGPSGQSQARRGMNDYKRIRRKHSGRHRHLRPDETVEMHRETVRFLRALPEHSGPTVVATHHAPHAMSLRERYADLNHCYATNLSSMIEDLAPEAWVHGHIHTQRRYRISDTLVVSNPRGHPEEASQKDFVADLVLEVEIGNAELDSRIAPDIDIAIEADRSLPRP